MTTSARTARAVVPFVLVWVAASASAQTRTSVVGRVVDAESGQTLPGATVVATRLTADSLRVGTAADAEGVFDLAVPAGSYRLRVSFVGYVAAEQTVAARGTATDVGRVALAPGAFGEAVVTGVQERVEVRGDTTVFNAAAFAVNPDATAEDLVAKMPGVVVQDGTVQARGETVQRVLVDGEEFFGSDPAAALRNLPAEIVQEIQVFDRVSDQAQFTGFDDGTAQLTINVVTRPDRRNGQFGRLYGGGGGSASDARYSAGGAVHAFQGTRRVSVIGTFNNVNDQNFSAEDLLGVLDSGEGGGRRGRRGGGPPGGGGSGGGPPGGGGGPGGGDAGTYLVGEQAGVTQTAALGVNVTDRVGTGLRLQGSYFLNRAGTDTDALGTRDYTLGTDLVYSEALLKQSTNWNHRLSGRIEATLSDATRLTVAPRLSLQTNAQTSATSAQSVLEDALVGLTRTDQNAATRGYSGTVDATLRHRLSARGRSVTLGVRAGRSGRSGDTDQDVLALGAEADTTDAYQRLIGSVADSRQASATITYTEPLGQRAQIQLTYAPGLSGETADRDAVRLDPVTGAAATDSLYAADTRQTLRTQRGGGGLRYNAARLRLGAGLDVQHEALGFEQNGAQPFSVDRTTTSLLPSANARVEITDDADLDLRYRAQTQVPGAVQLRAVVDDTNPLLVTAGNPDLRTARQHTADVRFRATQPASGSVLFGQLQLTATRDYIGSSVVVAGDAPVTVGGALGDVVLAPGAQLTRPVNLDGYVRARASGTVGRRVGRSNVNASLGATATRTPGLYNDALNRADALALDGRLFAGTGASTRFDAQLSYGLAWTRVANSSRTSADDAYLRHRATARLNWLPVGGWNVVTDVALSAYSGLDTGTAPTSVVWNAGLGYKFLPGDVAEVRLTARDILSRDAPVQQSVTDTYVETTQAQALGRFVMLGVSYRLRAFGQASVPTPTSDRARGGGRRERSGDGPTPGDGPPPDSPPPGGF